MNRSSLLLAGVLLAGCPAPPPPKPAPTAPPASTSTAAPAPTPAALFADVAERLKNEDPAWARYLGFHAFDGVVRDVSAEGFASRIETFRADLAALDALDPSPLDEEAKLDRELLRGHLRLKLFDLTEREIHRNNPASYDDVVDVSAYVNFDYAPMADRVRALIRHVETAQKVLPGMLDHLEPTLSKPVLEMSLKVLGGHAEYLRGDLVKALAPLDDPTLKKQAALAAAALATVVDGVVSRLEGEWKPRADATSHVMGKAKYLDFVEAQEGRRFTLAELKAMAEADWKRNHEAYAALKDSVKITRPPKDELLGVARDMVETSKAFIVEKDLMTIPSDAMPWVKETPPYMRWNAAFLNSMGPFEKEQKAYYYITLPDPSWPAEEQKSYIMPVGTLMATTVHEGFPGHYLHSLWYRRVPSDVQKMIDAYSFVEGWAHYTEQLMVEAGYADGDDEKKLGQLGDALLRNCRFLVSIGVHAEGMTQEQAQAKFADDCFQDPVTARQQAARATFDPGYFAYTLGKLQILELREELKAELGDAFSLKAFHDALLSHGGPPVALIADRVRDTVRAKKLHR